MLCSPAGSRFELNGDYTFNGPFNVDKYGEANERDWAQHHVTQRIHSGQTFDRCGVGTSINSARSLDFF